MFYEALKSSSQSGFQKFGILSKKGGNYGKIFKNYVQKITTTYIDLNWWIKVFHGEIIISKSTYLGILGIHIVKKLEKWCMDV